MATTRTDKLSEEEKYRIIIYYKDGMNINTISKKLNRNRLTISLYVNRYNEFGFDGLKRFEGTGKKPDEIKNEKNNSDIAQIIIGILYSNKFLTLTEIKSKLEDNENIYISTSAIRKLLIKNEFKFGFPPTRVPLNEEIKYRRIKFAIRYKNINWNQVLFTDECGIWRNKKSIKRWFNVNLGLDYDVIFKHSDKLNAWACICSEFKVIDIFSDNMDAKKYVQILTDNFLDIYDKNYYFQFDNDPKHTSSKAKTFLKNNEIKCIEFPSYSPDLNPIENVFGMLKNKIRKRKGEINSENFLKIIKEEWNKLDQNMIKNIINSMPNRLEKIISNKGEYINY